MLQIRLLFVRIRGCSRAGDMCAEGIKRVCVRDRASAIGQEARVAVAVVPIESLASQAATPLTSPDTAQQPESQILTPQHQQDHHAAGFGISGGIGPERQLISLPDHCADYSPERQDHSLLFRLAGL